MKKHITIVRNKVRSMAKVLLQWIIEHSLSLQLFIAICCILSCSFFFFIWYRVPHRTISYDLQTCGCVGYPKCRISAKMNYGYENIPRTSLGYSIEITQPLREHMPYLFIGNIHGTNVARTKEHYEEYESLCRKYPSAIDSISTLYKSIITEESDFTDNVISKDNEYWSNRNGIITYQRPTQAIYKTSKNETWFYIKRKSSIDSVSIIHNLGTSFDRPKWWSKGDVSKLDFELKFNTYNLVECEEISIHFNAPYSLYSTDIEPDKKGYDYIKYTNPFKLEVIHKKGLRLCASFPMFERLQQTRITSIIIIIPFLLSWLIHILRRIIAKRKNK